MVTGKEGPARILQGVLDAGGNNVGMGIAQENFPSTVPKELHHFAKTYKQKGFKGRLLVKEKDCLHYTYKGKKLSTEDIGEDIRYLPKEFFSPLSLEAYGSTLALIDWTEPITTIFVEKKEIADGFRKYFDVLWNMANP